MRDDLTVLVQRIHPRADDFEIFEFFSQCGKVRDIRLIRDQRSNKSKGVGYVEFENPQSVMNALALNGIAFKGQPLLVQASMAEKNRLAQQAKNVAAASAMMGGAAEPAALNKLIVSELHHNFTADDVREVFSPFGEIASIQLPNLGIAHIVFVIPEEAQAAEQAMNGIELAGKRLQCVVVAEKLPPPPPAAAIPNALPNMLPNMMMAGMLPGMMPGMMAGMMPGMMSGMMTGMMPGMMAPAMLPFMPHGALPGAAAGTAQPPAGPPSTYVLMKNLFDPNCEDARDDPHFFGDLKEDVIEEVSKHGDVREATVLRESAGHILFRFRDEQGAAKAVAALNGRWFAGKQVCADTMDEAAYAEMRATAAGAANGGGD